MVHRVRGLPASKHKQHVQEFYSELLSCSHAGADLIQLDSSPCILNGVVCLLLNVLLQQIAGQEAQTQLALPFKVEQEHSINDLQDWTVNTQHSIQCSVLASSRQGHCTASMQSFKTTVAGVLQIPVCQLLLAPGMQQVFLGSPIQQLASESSVLTDVALLNIVKAFGPTL